MPKRNPGARLEWRDDRQVWEVVWYERGQRKRKSTGTADRAIADQGSPNTLSQPSPSARVIHLSAASQKP